MNVFYIPSWYPSADENISGIFHQELIQAMAAAYPALNSGVSLWGQKTEANLIWAKDHLKNFYKLLRFPLERNYQYTIYDNLKEYYCPALTWSDKLFQGNIKRIIEANDENLNRFESDFGKTTIIHAQVAFPAGYIAMHLASRHKLPYVITEQMSPFPFSCYMRKQQIMDKVLLPMQKADAVIAISPHAARDIQDKTGVQPVIIPNLVNESMFSPLAHPAKSSDKQEQQVFTFFTLGRMVPQKGIPDLLKAIKLMSNKKVNFRIGGDGEHLQEYQALATQLQLDVNIQWLGELTRKEAAEEFKNCHAFVLPSIHESMGVVYAEALACGKPIIATRCGGPEFIVQEHNGLVVDVQAPDQLAGAMDLMIRLYSQYSPTAIREDFMKRFSSTAVTEKVYTLYRAILSQN
ncbi:glycosyltransferase [Cesiribacter sp. SM1]|uniref:glycosyltransferase n=1 Tax=Cesiribacter sp. SM1 TaxID=2861196 RepID=UPI001CD4F951|nr:glycosyltransferase [Cesiribacter sp. SM1]